MIRCWEGIANDSSMPSSSDDSCKGSRVVIVVVVVVVMVVMVIAMSFGACCVGHFVGWRYGHGRCFH